MSEMKKSIKPPATGLSGLQNIGNTCYLNSCMQILSHTYELNDFLDKKEYMKKLNNKPDSLLLLEWDKLREMMWSENCKISPGGFVSNVQKVSREKGIELFTGYSQNDIQEFLLFIIDSFHNAISRQVEMNITGSQNTETDILATKCYKMMNDMFSKDYSEILKLFYGICVSEISSDETTLSITPEPFFVLSIPIPEDSKEILSIYDCLDEFCKKEKLEGENAWYNEETDEKQDVEKGFVFWNFPDILIIHLKRWDYMGNKNNSFVKSDIKNLDLSSYVKGYNKDSFVYDLYGVCNHRGNRFGGHYTANVCVKDMDNGWYNFNDLQISMIKKPEYIVTSDAYCLFYRKQKK